MYLHAETAFLSDGWARNIRLKIADGRIASIETCVEAGAGDEHECLAALVDLERQRPRRAEEAAAEREADRRVARVRPSRHGQPAAGEQGDARIGARRLSIVFV